MKNDFKGPLDSKGVMDELIDKTGILKVYNSICDATDYSIPTQVTLKKKKWIIKQLDSGLKTKYRIDLPIKLSGDLHNSEIKTMFNQLTHKERDIVHYMLITIIVFSHPDTVSFLRDFIKYLYDSSTCLYKDNITATSHGSSEWKITTGGSFNNLKIFSEQTVPNNN